MTIVKAEDGRPESFQGTNFEVLESGIGIDVFSPPGEDDAERP